MNAVLAVLAVQLLVVVLIVAEALAFGDGAFTRTRDSSAAEPRPVQLTVQLTVESRERVDIPIWAALLATVSGDAVLQRPARHA